MSRARLLLLVSVVAAAAVTTGAQGPRRAANISALLAFPTFYHHRPIVIAGNVDLRDSGEIRLRDETGSIRVVFRGTPPDGVAEVRGEFWDLGRMNADDPRLGGMDLRRTFNVDPNGSWPRPGEVTAIVATAMAPAPQPSATIRGVVLFPTRYLDQRITLTGQFAGRNLLGDLPDGPALSRYDFVLRSADAAVWVTNMRPRGRDFDFALDTRLDTGRWLEVSGTVRQGRGLQWIEAEAGSLKIAKPPTDPVAVDPPIEVPAAPPPEVVFSAPTDGERDVSASVSVRVQFSRDINPASLKGAIQVTYAPAADAVGPIPVDFSTDYRPANRALEIRFPNGLERLRVVQVDLSDRVLGLDKQALQPWKLTFQVGQ